MGSRLPARAASYFTGQRLHGVLAGKRLALDRFGKRDRRRGGREGNAMQHRSASRAVTRGTAHPRIGEVVLVGTTCVLVAVLLATVQRALEASPLLQVGPPVSVARER